MPVLVFRVFSVLCESPRWLVVSRRFQEAEELLHRMNVVNGTQLPDDFNAEKIENVQDSSGSVLLLFKFPVMRIRTLITSFLCFTANLLYFSLSFNTGALSGDIYLNTLISSSLEIPAIIICIVLLEWKFLGRKFTTILTYLISGLSCLLCIPMTLLGIGTAETILSIIGKSLSVMSYTAVYVFASEIFPTEVRNAGFGLIQVFGGVANMAASFIGAPMAMLWPPLPYVVLGAFAVVATCLCLLLPETIGHPLQDTIQQAEMFKGGKVQVKVSEDSASNGSFPVAEEDGIRNSGFTEDSPRVSVTTTTTDDNEQPQIEKTRF